MPIAELFLLGYAIDTNVRHLPTVVFDAARTQESRALLRAFENPDDFDVIETVARDEDLSRRIVSGKAHAGIKIPEDYSRRLAAGDPAQVLVLVDGSDSTAAPAGVNVGNGVVADEALKLALDGRAAAVECRPRVLFDPGTLGANYFLPGLLVFLCQMMATVLTSNALVGKRSTARSNSCS